MARTLATASAVLLSAVVLTAQAPQAPKPGTEEQKLAPFIGTWTFEGETTEGPMGPGGKITGTDRISWLPGGFFVERRFEGKTPTGEMKGVEIMGYDHLKKAYAFSFFESSGVMGHGTATVDGSTWTTQGTGQMGAMTMQQRCKMTFGAANMTLAISCEASLDGKTWMPAFEGTARKVK